MDARPPDDQSASILNPRQVRILKFAVMAMGIAILLGLVVVFVQIMRLASRSPTPAAPLASASARPSALPLDITLPLPADARIRSWQLQAQRLAVEYEVPASRAGAQSEVVLAIIDLANGALVSRVHLGGGTANPAPLAPVR